MLMKIKNFILRILYFLIIIYLLIFVPSIWGYKPLVVMSGSMEPTLQVGGILYYHELNLEDFENGDILVYSTKEHIISHRLVDKTGDGFITKGDNNNTVDSSLVNDNQVLGKGTNWSIPFIGYYADYIYNHKYILFISVVIIIIDLCLDTYKAKKEKEGVFNEKIE